MVIIQYIKIDVTNIINAEEYRLVNGEKANIYSKF